MTKLSDDIWQVICDTHKQYNNLVLSNKTRRIIEERAFIKEFDGGVFITIGDEMDLYVLPERWGKWNINKELNDYFEEMKERFDKVKITINKNNEKCLRLAKHYNFVEVGTEDDDILMEREL